MFANVEATKTVEAIEAAKTAETTEAVEAMLATTAAFLPREQLQCRPCSFSRRRL